MEQREKFPPLDSVKQAQEVYSTFSRNVGNPEKAPDEILPLLLGEVLELCDSVEKKEDKVAIGGELADVVFFCLEIANQYGIPLNEAMGAKMTRNFIKYNPVEINLLIEKGMTRDEAVKFMKDRWDRSKDKDFA